MASGVAEHDINLLDQALVFQALDPRVRTSLADRSYRANYLAGAPIFHLGDPGQSMMVVLVGSVRIWLPTISGKELILADLGPGELFGEVAVLDGRERSAAATALTNCQLLVLDRADVAHFLKEQPDAALSLIALLCARLRRSDERMTDIAVRQLPTRLAKALLNRISPDTRPPARLALSQGELADMIGASRESVNRALRSWQRRGIVELRDGWIVLQRREALSALADCA